MDTRRKHDFQITRVKMDAFLRALEKAADKFDEKIEELERRQAGHGAAANDNLRDDAFLFVEDDARSAP